MALKTRSSFLFGYEVNADNYRFDIIVSAVPYVIELRKAYYSATELALEIAKTLNNSLAGTYSCTFNRNARTFTIASSTNVFGLPILTGVNNLSEFWSLVGFSLVADLSGLSTYTSTIATGTIYEPPFYLLDYVATESNKTAIEASLNQTGSGMVEITRFGLVSFMECSFEYITNRILTKESYIETNGNKYDEAIAFFNELIKKGHVEFMPDRDNAEVFEVLMLESTPTDNRGIGYRLVEALDFAEAFYRIKNVKFRKFEV